MGTPLNTLLKNGISAARQGRVDQARADLLRVIQIDERSVQAWYWLGRVVKSPREREICLENVLALDPAHTAVQGELADLRRKVTQVSAAAQRLDAGSELAGSDTSVQELGPGTALEPLSCPYCGADTGARDRRCPICHRGLYAQERRRAKHSVYSLGLVACWFALANYVWIALVVYYLFADLASAAASAPGTARTLDTLASLLSLEPRSLPALDLPLTPLLVAGGAIVAASLLVAWGLYRRLQPFYWLTVACIVLYPLSVLYWVLVTENASLLLLAVSVLLFLAAIGFAFLAHDEFSWDERRLTAEIDRDVDSHSALFSRGRRHAEAGMWAKAAAHWAKAAAHSPRNPDYRLALATAYLNLDLRDRAIEHLTSARRIDPDHPHIERLLSQGRGLANRTEFYP